MTQKVRFIFTLILTLLFMGLSGCAGATPVPVTPTEEPVEEESVPIPELATVSEPVEVNNCLECHTDKDQLISTAKAEEVIVSENEGEG